MPIRRVGSDVLHGQNRILEVEDLGSHSDYFK